MVTFFAAIFFFISYHLFDDISAVSTGYNASTRGFFAWTELFAEYDFNDDGDWVIKSSGTTLKLSALLAEIALCVTLAAVITTISYLLRPADRLLNREQADGGNRIQR